MKDVQQSLQQGLNANDDDTVNTKNVNMMI